MANASAEPPRGGDRTLHRDVLRTIGKTGIPFVVGGSDALAHYLGICRPTKDLDVHVRPRDCEPLLSALAALGLRTERSYPHWLVKAFNGTTFVDIIFSSGNGVCPVDDAWFAYAEPGSCWVCRCAWPRSRS